MLAGIFSVIGTDGGTTGTRRRRAWRKLHLSVDAGTGQIVAAALTGKEVDDAAQMGALLDQVTGSLASVPPMAPMIRMLFTPMSPSVTPQRR
jgi:hypothetical protein